MTLPSSEQVRDWLALVLAAVGSVLFLRVRAGRAGADVKKHEVEGDLYLRLAEREMAAIAEVSALRGEIAGMRARMQLLEDELRRTKAENSLIKRLLFAHYPEARQFFTSGPGGLEP